jgi:hypothetical protein
VIMNSSKEGVRSAARCPTKLPDFAEGTARPSVTGVEHTTYEAVRHEAEEMLFPHIHLLTLKFALRARAHAPTAVPDTRLRCSAPLPTSYHVGGDRSGVGRAMTDAAWANVVSQDWPHNP